MAADTSNRRPLVLLVLAILAAIVLSFLLLRDDAPQTPPAASMKTRYSGK